MKDVEMHEELSDKELRVYFSESLKDNYGKELALHQKAKADKQLLYQTSTRSEDFGSVRTSISIAKLDADFYTEYHRLLNNKLAMLILMREKGWKDWDVSDYVIKTGLNYMSFIGTENEYETLIENLKN